MDEIYFTTINLRDRGWTLALIIKLLPNHDKEYKDPTSASAVPEKLYLKSKVYEEERKILSFFSDY